MWFKQYCKYSVKTWVSRGTWHWLAPCAPLCSLCEVRVTNCCSRMGRENLHPGAVESRILGMRSHRFWQAMGNQIHAGISFIIKAISFWGKQTVETSRLLVAINAVVKWELVLSVFLVDKGSCVTCTLYSFRALACVLLHDLLVYNRPNKDTECCGLNWTFGHVGLIPLLWVNTGHLLQLYIYKLYILL